MELDLVRGRQNRHLDEVRASEVHFCWRKRHSEDNVQQNQWVPIALKRWSHKHPRRLHAHSQGTSLGWKLDDSAGASAGANKCQDLHFRLALRFDIFQLGVQHTIGLNLGLEDACSLAAPKYQLASEPSPDLLSAYKVHQLRLLPSVWVHQSGFHGGWELVTQLLVAWVRLCQLPRGNR